MTYKAPSRSTSPVDKKISNGAFHAMPSDIRKALTSDSAARTRWESLTPLARNEWICWVTFVKQDATRQDHVRRLVSELKEGKRRPCCWLGCTHRPDKAISPSVRGILAKRIQWDNKHIIKRKGKLVRIRG